MIIALKRLSFWLGVALVVTLLINWGFVLLWGQSSRGGFLREVLVFQAFALILLFLMSRERGRQEKARRQDLLAAEARHRQELEDRVAARTAELSQINATLLAEIAERQRAQAQVEVGRQNLRRFLDLSPTGILIREGMQVVYANPASRAILGLDENADLSQRPLTEWIHPDQYDLVAERIAEMSAIQEGATGVYSSALIEERWLRTDGTPVDVELVRFPFPEPNAGSVLIMFQDVSERKAAEAALSQSESLFRALTETTNAAIFIFEGERNLYVNPAAEKITGYSRQELLAMPFWQTIHPDMRDLVRSRGLHRVHGQDIPSSYDVQIVTKQGEVRWIEYVGRAVSFDGKPAVIGTAFDITERRRTEQALSEREARFSQLVDLIPNGVAVHQDGIIQFLNRAGAETLGLSSPAEIVGKPAIEFVHPDGRASAIARIRRLLETGEPAPMMEEIFIRSDGAAFDVEVAATPFQEHGRTAVQVVFRDITERKRAQQAAAQYTRRLELLSEIDNASLTGQPSAEIAQKALSSLRRLVPCQRASVAMYDEEVDEGIVLAVATDAPTAVAAGSRFPLAAVRQSFPDLLEYGETALPDIAAVTTAPEINRRLQEEGARGFVGILLKVGDHVIGVLSLYPYPNRPFSPDHRQIGREVGRRLSIALGNARLFAEIRQAEDRQRALARRVVEVQEEERRNLARELHDEIGQTLTGLKLALDSVRQVSPADPSGLLAESAAVASKLLQQVRQLSLELRPSMLDSLGLLPTLLWHLDLFGRRTGISVEIQHSGIDRRFDPAIETAAYRLVQEALTNVARHAQAPAASVRLWAEDGFLHIRVDDAGVGFDPVSAARTPPSSGLAGMRQRAEAVGGEIHIDSQPGRGVTILASLPIDHPRLAGGR